MHGVLMAVIGQGQPDPDSLRPAPASAAVFVLLAVATILLLVSMVRHLRRAQRNLGPTPPAGGREASSDPVEGGRR